MVEVTALSAAERVREDYFGTAIRPRTFSAWIEDIDAQLRAGARRHLSGHHNLHSLYLLHKKVSVAAFYRRCDDCYVDGVPGRLSLAGCGERTRRDQRFSLMDHFTELLATAAQRSWSLYYLGSRQAVVAAAGERIHSEYPGLRITLHHGYFEDDAGIVAAINRQRPDLLLVGMGMPRQERWLLDRLGELDVGCAIQAGATLDYFTGAQARPPRCMSSAGLAWLYRLAHNPTRLWRRYLAEPWALIIPTLRHWSRYRAASRPQAADK